jgi:enoyl-CoA hydratase/carnithine racemase
LVTARTAAEWGLVNQAVPAASLQSATRGLAEDVAAASSLVVATGKQASTPRSISISRISISRSLRLRQESHVNERVGLRRAGRHRTFRGKRAPCWSDKNDYFGVRDLTGQSLPISRACRVSAFPMQSW